LNADIQSFDPAFNNTPAAFAPPRRQQAKVFQLRDAENSLKKPKGVFITTFYSI